MLERIAQLMANPNSQMQSGLDMIAGTTPQELLARAQVQGLQSENAERNRKAEGRAYISQVLSQGELTPEVVRQVMRYDPEYGLELMRAMQGSEQPSSVREYEYFNSLSPEDQGKYLTMKRSSQIMNLGGTQAVYDPLTQGKGSEFDVTLSPGELPETRRDQAAAAAAGADIGAAEALLVSSEAKFPELEKTVQELSEIGKVATYSEAGKARDWLLNQAGKEATGATARADYIARVDNQVLPLLRDTFGAAFTQKEGESLRATLGDPDKTPAQKDAVLRSFIEQKRASIESLRRQTGAVRGSSGGGSPSVMDSIGQSDIDPAIIAQFPDAKKGDDGNWYVKKDGQTFMVRAK
jgi:hypothetical protein